MDVGSDGHDSFTNGKNSNGSPHSSQISQWLQLIPPWLLISAREDILCTTYTFSELQSQQNFPNWLQGFLWSKRLPTELDTAEINFSEELKISISYQSPYPESCDTALTFDDGHVTTALTLEDSHVTGQF